MHIYLCAHLGSTHTHQILIQAYTVAQWTSQIPSILTPYLQRRSLHSSSFLLLCAFSGALQTYDLILHRCASPHLQPPDLIQVQLEAAIDLSDEIPVVQNHAHLVGLRPPQPAYQILLGPLEQLLVGQTGDVLCWTFGLRYRELELGLGRRSRFLHWHSSSGTDKGQKILRGSLTASARIRSSVYVGWEMVTVWKSVA